MNAFLKTFLVSLVGVGAPLLQSIVNSPPTGGFATYLGTHPMVGAAYGIAAYALHNALSEWKPPSTVVTKKDVGDALPPAG